MINHMEIKSVFKTYKVDFTNHYQIEPSHNDVLVIDRKVMDIYGSRYNAFHHVFHIDANEETKNMSSVLKLVDYLMEVDFTKKDTLFVVGGGITQDIGSMCAALFKRGVDWVYTPTTLLSMSDSCIGSKMGVNHNGSKNQLGTFYPPTRVVIDVSLLESLDTTAIHSGMGEILKLYTLDKRPWDIPDLADALKICLQIKKDIIEEDELEKTIRPCLNYGHTFGHIFESVSDFKIPHGVAVLMGMYVIDKYFNLNVKRFFPYINMIRRYSSHIKLDPDLILKHLKADKKVMGDKITLIKRREFVEVDLNKGLVESVISIVENDLLEKEEEGDDYDDGEEKVKDVDSNDNK